MRHSFVLLLLLCFIFQQSFAQKKKKQDKNKNESSVEPYYPEVGKYEPKAKKGKSQGITYNSQRNADNQREAVAKQKRYNARQLDKPQHTEKSYFGHKRKPKKRPVSKMKLCKECGLRH